MWTSTVTKTPEKWVCFAVLYGRYACRIPNPVEPEPNRRRQKADFLTKVPSADRHLLWFASACAGQSPSRPLSRQGDCLSLIPQRPVPHRLGVTKSTPVVPWWHGFLRILLSMLLCLAGWAYFFPLPIANEGRGKEISF